MAFQTCIIAESDTIRLPLLGWFCDEVAEQMGGVVPDENQEWLKQTGTDEKEEYEGSQELRLSRQYFERFLQSDGIEHVQKFAISSWLANQLPINGALCGEVIHAKEKMPNVKEVAIVFYEECLLEEMHVEFGVHFRGFPEKQMTEDDLEKSGELPERMKDIFVRMETRSVIVGGVDYDNLLP